MFLIRIHDIAPLFNGTTLFTLISNEAEVQISQLAFSIVVRNPSPGFVAIMLLPHHLFVNYAVAGKQFSKISLQAFHAALLEGQNFSSITIHLLESLNRLILRFESANHLPRLRHELPLSAPDELSLGKPCHSKFFAVAIQEFKRIITTLSPYTDQTISVTLTGSQVKFSVASEEIILRAQREECLILGDGEPEMQLKISLHPTAFFLNMANQASRVWFFKTDDNRCVINFPYHVDARYLVYYPQM